MEGDDSLGAQPEAHMTTEREHTVFSISRRLPGFSLWRIWGSVV